MAFILLMRDNPKIISAATFKKVFIFIVLLFLFTVFLNLLIHSVDIDPKIYKQVFSKSSNVFFVAFFFGIMASAIVQSSSAITTLAVALVAQGEIEMEYAIPIVIGSNIGTTITPFIFSFAHSDKRGDFKKALSVAFAHNIFNVFSAILIIIVEFKFGFLSYLSFHTGHYFYSGSYGNAPYVPTLIDMSIKPITVFIMNLIGFNWVCAIIGFVGMYASIKGFVRLFTKRDNDKESVYVKNGLFSNHFTSFLFGVFGTAFVHSSSTTISILETVVCSYKISAKKAFCFVIGANIGTTFTALLAGFFNKEAALQLAFTHFLFNTIGALIFGLIPPLNALITKFADFLAEQFETFRSYLIIYISILFFIIPLLLIYVF